MLPAAVQIPVSSSARIPRSCFRPRESPKGTFTAYTGYEKLPSFKGYDVQYTTVNGYVDMIYVYAYEVTTRTVFIYDTTDYHLPLE